MNPNIVEILIGDETEGILTVIDSDIFIYLFSLYLTLTFPSLQLKPINVN